MNEEQLQSEIVESMKAAFPSLPEHAVIEIIRRVYNNQTDDDIFQYLFDEGYTESVNVEYPAYKTLKQLNPEDTSKLVITIKNIIRNANTHFQFQNNVIEQLHNQQINEMNRLRLNQNKMIKAMYKQNANQIKENLKRIELLESKWFQTKSVKTEIRLLKRQNKSLKQSCELYKSLKQLNDTQIKESTVKQIEQNN